MGAGKDMWIAEVEKTEDQFVTREIDEDQFSARMQRLGFRDTEISEMVSALTVDRDNG